MSPVRRFTIGAALAAAVVLATALPAAAHDSLVDSTPEAGEQLAVAPESITLTFSGELLVLGDSTEGAVVLVIDGDGKDWATGDVEVSGSTVTATVDPGMPDAGYQVRWQVVSEDGHPISGVVPFTIGDGEALASTQAPTDADAGPYAPEETPAVVPDTDQNADQTDGAVRALIVGGAGAAVAVIAFVIYRILRRPKTAAAGPDDSRPAEEL